MGSGSGSGSGWMCGVRRSIPAGSRRTSSPATAAGEPRTSKIDGANTRLATIQAGGSVELHVDYTVAVKCTQGKTCPLQLQIGTNTAKIGCVFAGDAVGDKINIAAQSGSDQAMTLSFGTPGSFAIMVDPASNGSGCGAAWTNGQPTDLGEIVAFVCVTAP